MSDERTRATRVAIICTALLSALLIGGFTLLRWPILGMYVPISDVANILAPLILTAAFIERAVEVVISPFRDEEANSLRRRLADLQAAKPLVPAEVSAAQADLDHYSGQTQKYAFCALVLLGLLAAVVGVRAIELFLIQPRPAPPTPQPLKIDLGPGQMGAFRTFDVVISALLLAGGAVGLHAPINALTSFFNNSATQNLKNSAATGNAATNSNSATGTNG